MIKYLEKILFKKNIYGNLATWMDSIILFFVIYFSGVHINSIMKFIFENMDNDKKLGIIILVSFLKRRGKERKHKRNIN